MALVALLVNTQPPGAGQIIPVHIDHQLRPDSAQDALWVAQTLRERFGLTVATVQVTVVQSPGESLEMAARDERYRVLHEYRRRAGHGGVIVVAHHLRDQAETVLMRMISGTGLAGLQAMRERNGVIVRPLLAFTPRALREYLGAQNLAWREDSTNQDPYWTRNRIRLELLPLLRERFNPRIEEALASLALRAQEAVEVVQAASREYVAAEHVDVAADPLNLPESFSTLAPAVQADILAEVARARGIRLSRDHIRGAQEGMANWPAGVTVRRKPRRGWRIASRAAQDAVVGEWLLLPERGILPWDGGAVLTVGVENFEKASPGAVQIDRGRWPRLAVRGWRDGDRIEVFGMKGKHKKLQDIFTDAKIPQPLRRVWPVVVSADDLTVVLALPGIAVAESARCKIHGLCTRIHYNVRDSST